MKIMWIAIEKLWLLAVAYIPLAQHAFMREFTHDIGCPARGDCYVPGSEHLLDLELLNIGSAVLLWPPCAWFLICKPIISLWRLRQRDQARRLGTRDAQHGVAGERLAAPPEL